MGHGRQRLWLGQCDRVGLPPALCFDDAPRAERSLWAASHPRSSRSPGWRTHGALGHGVRERHRRLCKGVKVGCEHVLHVVSFRHLKPQIIDHNQLQT